MEMTKSDRIRLYVHLAPFAIAISVAMGAWVGYVSHSQHMSLVRHINSSK